MVKRLGVGIALLALLALATACDTGSGTATTVAIVQPTNAPTITAATRAPLATGAATVVLPTIVVPTSAATRAATSAATAAATPTQGGATTGSPLDIILNASRAQLAAKSFRTQTTLTTANNTQMTTTFEYVNPDRVHIIMANGNETIVIKGVGTYSKTSGKWAVSPVDLSSTVFGQFDPKTIEDLKSSIVTSNVKVVGPDVLAGRPVIVITYDTLVKGLGLKGSDIHGTTRLWLGATDGLPYRRESTQDSAVTEGAKTSSFSVYEYDPNIKIEKPI